jgi:hypothetical protein
MRGIAATLYILVCFRYISVNTLHTGDNVIIIIIIIIIIITFKKELPYDERQLWGATTNYKYFSTYSETCAPIAQFCEEDRATQVQFVFLTPEIV